MSALGTTTLAEVFAAGADFELGHQHGACRDQDPDLFFTEAGQSSAEGKAICAGCPVRAECLDFALDTGQRFGVWGGTSVNERRGSYRDSGVKYDTGHARGQG